MCNLTRQGDLRLAFLANVSPLQCDKPEIDLRVGLNAMSTGVARATGAHAPRLPTVYFLQRDAL